MPIAAIILRKPRYSANECFRKSRDEQVLAVSSHFPDDSPKTRPGMCKPCLAAPIPRFARARGVLRRLPYTRCRWKGPQSSCREWGKLSTDGIGLARRLGNISQDYAIPALLVGELPFANVSLCN